MPWVTSNGVCTGFEVLVEEFIQLFLLDCQGVDLGAEVVGIWFKLDGMVPLLLIRQFIKGLTLLYLFLSPRTCWSDGVWVSLLTGLKTVLGFLCLHFDFSCIH